MSVQDRLRTWVLRGMVKATTLPVPFVSEWRRVQYMTPSFKALCQEGVRANGIVFNCLSAHVFAYPEAKLRVYRQTNNGLEPLPNHPLQDKLDHPNEQMGQAELLQYISLYKAIGGNCYLYKVRSKAGRLAELLPLNDSQITPVAGATLPIGHYLWTNEETGKDEPIPASDIVHLKWMPDPLAPWRGLAPLMAVAREIDTDNEARRYIFNLLKNDAVPRAVVTAAPGTTPLSNEERTRLENLLMDKYGGDNRGKMAVLGGLSIQRIGLDLQEMAYEALSRAPEARIAGSFRVPPVMAFLNVGLEQMTYNNMEGMDRFFTQRTMVPLWRMDADEIGADLLKEYGNSDGLVVKFDTSEVAALQEAVKEKRDWVDSAVRNGYMTVAEAQAHLGMPVDPQGNYYLRTFTVQAVSFGATPEATLAPVPKGLLLPGETKAKADRRQMMLALIAAQRQNRADVAARMEGALDNYFGGLADRIINRALTAGQPKGLQRKGIQDSDLLFDSDAAELEALVKRFYVDLLQLSWQNWNLELGVDVQFDTTDPAVTKALEGAGARVKKIQETTRTALQDALQFGSDNGWSIDHLVRGDRELGRPGLRDLVEQTYKGRAKTIARTELGTAQNQASGQRYASAGVDRVLVLDNGVDDSDPRCVILGNGGKGTIMSLAWYQANLLQHPNCLRTAGAAFPDDGPIDEAAMRKWQEAGGTGQTIEESEVGVKIGEDAKALYGNVPASLRGAAEKAGLKEINLVSEAELWKVTGTPRMGASINGTFTDDGRLFLLKADDVDLPGNLSHEMAHALDAPDASGKYGVSESPEWLKAGGWKQDKKGNYKLTESIMNRPVSDYGRTAPWEDFAESYRIMVSGTKFERRVMMGESEDRYNWMKDFLAKKGYSVD